MTLVSPSDFAALNYSLSCENKIETTQMRSSANPTLTQMRENGEIQDDATSASSTAGSEGGLTRVQSGAIGAMVSLVVVFVLLFVCQLFGWMTIGKKQVAARRQAHAAEENQVSHGALRPCWRVEYEGAPLTSPAPNGEKRRFLQLGGSALKISDLRQTRANMS